MVRGWPGTAAIGRWWRGVRPSVWRSSGPPATFLYLFVLSITTWVLLGLTGDIVDSILREHSTNLDQLRTNPVRVLIRSAFWVDGYLLLVWVVLFALVLAPAERWLGTVRWLVVFVAGHVGATLATAAGLWLAIRWRLAPSSLSDVVDVGVSYGFAALAAVFTYRLPPPGALVLGQRPSRSGRRRRDHRRDLHRLRTSRGRDHRLRHVPHHPLNQRGAKVPRPDLATHRDPAQGHHRPVRLRKNVVSSDTQPGMNTCALTRVLWPAFLAGLLVGSLAGNDTWGWLAAALTAGSIYAVQRVRGTDRSCSFPRPVPHRGRRPTSRQATIETPPFDDLAGPSLSGGPAPDSQGPGDRPPQLDRSTVSARSMVTSIAGGGPGLAGHASRRCRAQLGPQARSSARPGARQSVSGNEEDVGVGFPDLLGGGVSLVPLAGVRRGRPWFRWAQPAGWTADSANSRYAAKARGAQTLAGPPFMSRATPRASATSASVAPAAAAARAW